MMQNDSTMKRTYGFLRRNFVMAVVSFQILFLLAQLCVFYPCFHIFGLSARAAEVLDNKNNAYLPNEKRNIDEIHMNQEQKSPFKYQPNWESLESRPMPDWYDDAKIGIFIHWGVFSVPSYVGVGTKGLSEWFWYYLRSQQILGRYHTKPAIESSLKFMAEHYRPGFEYQDFVRDFTAEFYDPDHWADIFHSSGAKYIVLTSKHHEGFTLWQSKRSWNWNAVDVGPHRDILGDLAEAVRKKPGLRFGLYHSLYEWFNPLYLEDKANNFTTQSFVRDKLMPEMHEVVTKYKPEVVWTDGHWDAPCSYWNCTNFIAWLYNESPVKDTVVTNDRWGNDVQCKHGGYWTCHDRYNPKKAQARKWENCMTLDRESWGYRRNAKLSEYFTMEQLLTVLAQTISYGGNILINVGPTHDGRIPPIFEERLRQLGQWLQVNGEAIYGTTVWTHPEDEKGNEKIYYTKKGQVIYAIILEWPEADKLDFTAPLPTDRTVVSWLGYRGDSLKWQKGTDGGITVGLPRISPSKLPCQWAWVFKFEGLQNP